MEIYTKHYCCMNFEEASNIDAIVDTITNKFDLDDIEIFCGNPAADPYVVFSSDKKETVIAAGKMFEELKSED